MYRVKKIGVLFLVAALGCSTGVFRGATKLYAAESGVGGEVRVVIDSLRVEQGASKEQEAKHEEGASKDEQARSGEVGGGAEGRAVEGAERSEGAGSESKGEIGVGERVEVDSVAKESRLMGGDSAEGVAAGSEKRVERVSAEDVGAGSEKKRGVAERGSAGEVVEGVNNEKVGGERMEGSAREGASERSGGVERVRREGESSDGQRGEQEVLQDRELIEEEGEEGEEGEAREEVKYVSAEKMFGERSSVVLWSARDLVEKREEGVLTENVYFKGALLICFIIFCLILYLYRGQASKLLEIVRKSYYIERVLEEQNYLFDKFTSLLIFVGMIGQSLFFVKLAEVYLTGQQEGELPQWVISVLVPAGVVMLTAVLYYQLGVIAISGRLSGNERFAQSLSKMHRVMAALVAILTTPIILMFALSDGVAMMILLYIIMAIAIGALIFLIIRTLKLFVEKKVSILYWFLYLCIVGVFPLSFLALLLLKSI